MDVNSLHHLFDYPAITIQDSFVFSHDRLYDIRVCPEHIPESLVIKPSKTISLAELSLETDLRFDNAVISYGANASVKYLLDKFAGMDVAIPVLRTRLRNHDVVYASYFCSDGTLPATIVERKDAVIDVYYSFISDQEMQRLNETESLGVDYRLKSLDSSLFSHSLDFTNRTVCYECLHGPLQAGGTFFSMNALSGIDRCSQPFSQYQIQRMVHGMHFSHEDFYAFCESNVRDEIKREHRTRVLKGAGDGI